MSLINHPNLLQAHCSFTTGHHLWVVMPYMAGGSCLQIMKSSYSEGFEEPVIATLLCEVLKALIYLHSHGHIHRDVKVCILSYQPQLNHCNHLYKEHEIDPYEWIKFELQYHFIQVVLAKSMEIVLILFFLHIFAVR